jgi:hypothetical protein
MFAGQKKNYPIGAEIKSGTIKLLKAKERSHEINDLFFAFPIKLKK